MEGLFNTWMFRIAGRKEHLGKYFKIWSDKMDELYLNGPDRHNAVQWIESPKDWMTPYDEEIFLLWCDYDTNSPTYQKEYEAYCERHHK